MLACLRAPFTWACLTAFGALAPAQQYVFQTYGQADGLASLSIRALASDRAGFLWVATADGVFRFLGSGFEHFGPAEGIREREIEDIFADPNGTVWAGTSENLYRWDGQRFVPANQQPIPIWGAQRIAAEDAHHLLIVDKSQVYRLEHDAAGRVQSYLPAFSTRQLAGYPDLRHVTSITIVGHGSTDRPSGRDIWMGCGRKLCAWFNGRGSVVNEWGSEAGVTEDLWSSVVRDQSGTVWAAGQHRVLALTLGAQRFVDRSPPGIGQEPEIREPKLIEDRSGRVIVPVAPGVSRWDGGSWRTIGAPNGLAGRPIADMVFDQAGDLWLGSSGRGLFHWIGYEDWESWSDRGGLPSANTLAVTELGPSGAIAGTENGPAWVDARDGSVIRALPGQRWAFGPVSALVRGRDGAVLAATSSGEIVRLDRAPGASHESHRLPASIAAAIQDRDGTIYFATTKGIFVRRLQAANEIPLREPAADALIGDQTPVEAGCLASDGSVWFAAGSQLLVVKNGSWAAPPVDGLPRLPGPFSALACGADGSVWATGARSGTWRLSEDGLHMKAWQLALPAGLGSVSPVAILADSRGWVWLGSDAGLLVWKGGQWRHLTQESGLLSNAVNRGALIPMSDGSLWVGTASGLSRLAHPEHVFNASPLDLAITAIERDGVPVANSGSLVMHRSSAPLRFHFSSPTMRNRGDLVFAYTMQGLGEEWIETRTGEAAFPSLPPGDYTFLAVARNPGLGAASTPASIAIRVLAPWWKSPWMYGFAGVILVLILGGLDRMRARRLRRNRNELDLIARRRSHLLESSRNQARRLANQDSLTGLYTPTAMRQALVAEIARAQRISCTLVVALAAADNFSLVNDLYGVSAGDEALRQFAAALAAALRPGEHAGRYEGERFVLILPNIPPAWVEQRLNQIHASLTRLSICTEDSDFLLESSLGAILFDPSASAADPETLVEIAGQALSEARQPGRNRVVCRRDPANEVGHPTLPITSTLDR